MPYYDAFATRYGYFEIRTRFLSGSGLAPAFWFLGMQDAVYTENMEVDSPEVFTKNNQVKFNLLPRQGMDSQSIVTDYGPGTTLADLNDGYHIYGLEWNPEYLKLYIPAFDSVRQALPMVQALLQMALVICIPLITLCSAWDMKAVMTLTFVQFALFFLTFWWELARWLDSWLLGVLYSSDTHSSWNLAGIQNSQDDVIINLVMGSMFLVLPTFWLGAMTWAGVRVGVAVNGALTGGVKVAQDSGGKAGRKLL
ncbi:family 16 glycosylhydrolase [Salmonella enterica]|nr:family 16 glycosylhydrolase [Salmonella enterica]